MPNQREDRRLMRINALRRKIIENWKNGQDTDMEALIAWASVNYGTARRTSIEYIMSIINSSNRFELLGKIIYYKGDLAPNEEKIFEELEKNGNSK